MRLRVLARLRLFRKADITNTIRKEVTALGQRWVNFPKDNPEEVNGVLDLLDSLCPQGKNTKKYVMWLAQIYWNVNDEDHRLLQKEAEVRRCIHDFDRLCDSTLPEEKGVIDTNINNYKTLAQLEETLKGILETRENNIGSAQYTEEQRAIIAAGSEIVLNSGPWIVYRCGGSDAEYAATRLLCDNKLNNVSWCVGRGKTEYQKNGFFYVLERDGVSRYAISTERNNKSATIWSPSDAPIWQTCGYEQPGFKNLFAAASELGITLDLTKISSIPPKLIPILKELVAADSYLRALIPDQALVAGDTKDLDRAIWKAGISLADDFNQAFKDANTVGIGHAVMGRAIATHSKFDWPALDTNSLVGWIEIFAAQGNKTLPPSLEQFFISQIEAA